MDFFESPVLMKKSKSMENPDRLSELPDSLIFSIFWLLPMTDVVATTILSKRWRNLWTTAPYLNFSHRGNGNGNGNGHGSEHFINRSLMFWRGPTILKMRIALRCKLSDRSLLRDIDLWVRFAKDFGVQELHLHPTGLYDEQLYTVPQYLFSSCPSLRVLSLIGCRNYDIPMSVQWHQLKSLTIHSDHGLGYDSMNLVMRGSPQLEVLDLSFGETHDHLSIQSSSLKKLTIEKYLRYEQEASPTDIELIIWAPNLETFKISGVPYRYCYLENVSSLTSVTLLFDEQGNLFPEDDILEKILAQIFSTIQHVQNVTLSDSCIKALWSLKRKHLVPALRNVNFLKLESNFLDHEEVAGVVEIFPNVKMLVLADENIVNAQPKSCIELRPNLPYLTRVEVAWGEHAYLIFPFLEVLLKSASRLEMMVFRVRRDVQPRQISSPLFLASQQLLRMQRSSPTAKLLFCE